MNKIIRIPYFFGILLWFILDKQKNIINNPPLIIAALETDIIISATEKVIPIKKLTRFTFILGMTNTSMLKDNNPKYPSWFGLLKKSVVLAPVVITKKLNINWIVTDIVIDLYSKL